MDPWLRLGVHCVWGSDYSVPSGSLHHGAMEKIRNLRQITAVINGQEVTLVSTGAVAHVLGRTRWCVDNWITLGLLPKPPFVINPNDDVIKRRLYPAAFVERLAVIANQIGPRLPRSEWQGFHDQVVDVYNDVVGPLIPIGITLPVLIVMDQTNVGRVVIGNPDPSSTASPLPSTKTA